MGQRTPQFYQRRRSRNHHQHCTVLHSPPISNTTLPFSNASYLWLLVLVFVTCSATFFTVTEGKSVEDLSSSAEHHEVFKRSASEGSLGASDYPDYQSGVRYDEYPVVVPKRTALLLDRIMVALQKAVEDEKADRSYPNGITENKMDLQRRGQQKGRVYWRCYFNAVTCFKRK